MADISKITLPSNDVYNIKDGSAIANITRSGTTFTATRRDGTTFTFTQQDNDTTYTANTANINVVSLGENELGASNITGWTANTPTSISYTSRSIPNVTSVGSRTITNLTLTATSVNNGQSTTDYLLTIPASVVTDVTVPTLGTDISADDITNYSMGTAASLSYSTTSIPDISITSTAVVTGITAS